MLSYYLFVTNCRANYSYCQERSIIKQQSDMDMNTNGTSFNQADLARKAKQERFMNLLRPYHKRLERFALTMTRNREDAKDVVGETVLLAYEHLETLRNDDAFIGFLLQSLLGCPKEDVQKKRRHCHRRTSGSPLR